MTGILDRECYAAPMTDMLPDDITEIDYGVAPVLTINTSHGDRIDLFPDVIHIDGSASYSPRVEEPTTIIGASVSTWDFKVRQVDSLVNQVLTGDEVLRVWHRGDES